MGISGVGKGVDEVEDEDEGDRLGRHDDGKGAGYCDGCGGAFARPQLLVNGWVANGLNELRGDADWAMAGARGDFSKDQVKVRFLYSSFPTLLGRWAEGTSHCYLRRWNGVLKAC